MASSPYKDASTLLSAFFDKERFAEGGRFAELYASWRNIAGERYAAHSRPDDVVKGILYVEVEHPGWIQLLQFRQAGILEAVKRSYPELKLRSIVFRLARDGKQAAFKTADSVHEDVTGSPSKTGGGESVQRINVQAADDGSKDDSGGDGQNLFAEPSVDPEVKSMFSGLKKLVDSGSGG